MHDVGNDATDLLLKRMKNTGPEKFTTQLVEPRLQVRKSSVRSR
jgi:DNA-binding LacI/PurR family transcriptional regulator